MIGRINFWSQTSCTHTSIGRNRRFENTKSFSDFYSQQLEETWGSWKDLQATWAEVAAGRLSEKKAKERILQHRGAPLGNRNAAKSDLVLAREMAEALVKGCKERQNKPDNIRFEYGTDRNYTLARLDRKHPELAAQVRTGETGTMWRIRNDASDVVVA